VEANNYEEQCVPAGGEGEHCYSDWSCDAGLGCTADEYCLPSVGLGEACDPNQTPCDSGLRCMPDSDGSNHTCEETGEEFQACNRDYTCNETRLECVMLGMRDACYERGTPNSPCDTGNTCYDSTTSCVYSDQLGGYFCLSTGGIGEICNADQTCDDAGAECISVPEDGDICYIPGDENSPCDAMTCNSADLECIWSDDHAYDFCFTTGGLNEHCHGDLTCDSPSHTCRQDEPDSLDFYCRDY
jgi:hypothetical protein